MKAIQAFKDEYFLDFINTQELDLTDPQDMDERVLKNQIISYIRNFIQCLGFDFCFVRNQHRIEVDGEEFFADLLFFKWGSAVAPGNRGAFDKDGETLN